LFLASVILAFFSRNSLIEMSLQAEHLSRLSLQTVNLSHRDLGGPAGVF
jgi:hypothetical protein